MREYFVYLSGPITGLSYDEAKGGWRYDLWKMLVERRELGRITLLSPMRKKEHLRGTTSLAGDGPLADNGPSWKPIIARDYADVKRSDLMVANFTGATRVSIGTMIEFGFAVALGVPILAICTGPIGPHKHGWVQEIPIKWVETVDDAADFIANFCSDGM